VQDQRFVDNRPDVLTWTSAPLDEDLTLAGDVVAHLFASTTGTDADWVVKLIDVYPDSDPDLPQMGGYQLIVNADILRGRYWKGFARATPVPANTVTPFTVEPARAAVPLPEGASPHGADPEHLVPALRSQSSALRA
jgi:predicted acyl esterase